MKSSSKGVLINILLISLVLGGLWDAFFLTLNHFSNTIPPCHIGFFSDCGKVLNSPYAVIYGVPVALLGLIHYTLFAIVLANALFTKSVLFKRLTFLFSAIGLVVSILLMFVQFFIIQALCLYCTASAIISLCLYILIRIRFHEEYRELIPTKVQFLYQLFGKPAFFIFDPEWVHDNAMFFGERFGKIPYIRRIFTYMFRYVHPALKQKIEKITFPNPLGLAAGYDYEAAFPKILPSIGFGFETMGTMTNNPCEGNEKPRLGRLIKSKSLLVNKGFRNPGADKIIKKLNGETFEIPVGISVGVTNDSTIETLQDAIKDIVSAYQKFEKSKLRHSYYELNISCPNLKTKVSFYHPKGLNQLLDAISKLPIKKPVFIKMPIEKSDEEVKKMLNIIIKYRNITGVIFGNLQKNRKDPALLPEEVDKMGKGNFSGKPTFKRSNELIKLAYKGYGNKLIIIGCGGVFNAEDAYKKIRSGATLVQMITGMIFEGPQVIAQINRGLVKLLKRDGFKHISEAVGVDVLP